MTGFLRLTTITAALLISSMAQSGQAGAFDLNGAWAGDADNCSKVFTRKGSQVTFSDDSDVYGSGFIVEGDRMTGKSGKCRIKLRKDDGATINLIAECASDIMFQSMQFNLKEVDPNTLMRLFPGMEGIEIKYARCPAP